MYGVELVDVPHNLLYRYHIQFHVTFEPQFIVWCDHMAAIHRQVPQQFWFAGGGLHCQLEWFD